MDRPILVKSPGEAAVISPEEYRKYAREKGYYYVRLSCGLVRVRPTTLKDYIRLFRYLGVTMNKENLERIARGGSWEEMGIPEEKVMEEADYLTEFMGTSITIEPRVYPAPDPGEPRDPERLYWDELLEEDQAALVRAYSLLQEVMGRKFRPGEPSHSGGGDDSEGIRQAPE